MKLAPRTRRVFIGLTTTGALCLVGSVIAFGVGAAQPGDPGPGGPPNPATSTPIQHLVVIFQENVSFDHYFATYPVAANLPGEPPFTASPDTPSVNGLTPELLTHNPNLSNPQRLDRSQALTCDQDHGYSDEQSAADMGLMDQFVQKTGHQLTLVQCLTSVGDTAPVSSTSPNYAVMDYYDGNTVTGIWNLAQHFAMDDNAYGTTFGPSTPGALNVVAGQTYGTLCGPASAVINAPVCGSTAPTPPTNFDGLGTTYSDSDPYYDMCSTAPAAEGGDAHTSAQTIAMTGTNVGDLLNSKGVTWGWFEGGFDDGYVPGQGTPPTPAQVCSENHKNIGGASVTDYIPHHEPFEYYASTANPAHNPPSSVAMIGHTDAANHQYDLADFWAAADAGNMPAVSYIKAPAYEDGHAGYSDPLDEQSFLATTINHLEQLPTWRSTAVVITYDDSDGWYDHQMGAIVDQSNTSTGSSAQIDTLSGAGLCGSNPAAVPSTDATPTQVAQPEEGRCGYGPRLPFLVVSPWARTNFVSNQLVDQSSVVSFIEDNWGLGSIGNGSSDALAGSIAPMFDFQHPSAPPIFLDPSTGEPGPGPGPGGQGQSPGQGQGSGQGQQ